MGGRHRYQQNRFFRQSRANFVIRARERDIGRTASGVGANRTAIGSCAPDPQAIHAKDVSRRSDWFRPGECRNLIYDVLRHPEAPVPTRTIAEPFMLAKDYRPERHAGGGADQAKRVGGTREDGVS